MRILVVGPLPVQQKALCREFPELELIFIDSSTAIIGNAIYDLAIIMISKVSHQVMKKIKSSQPDVKYVNGGTSAISRTIKEELAYAD